MAQIPFRVNLSSEDMPFLSQFMGQTVIMSRVDQDYDLDVKQTQRLQKERQIPQAYYAHNVMPSGKGYQSIGFIDMIPAMTPAVTDFNRIFTLRDQDENKILFSPSFGKNYIYDKPVGNWASVSPIIGHEDKLVTVAYVNGETYIYYERVGCFKYNTVTKTLDSVILVGLLPEAIYGITSANGFLIAWDNFTVYRSQYANPLDFTPAPELGSGSGIPEDIKGKIVVCLPIPNGYIIYTTKNMVSASFQQNIRFPFINKEIEGSSGISSPDHVSWQDNLGAHYAWTLAGLQKVNKTQAIPIFPDITDFLIAKVFEDYDTATHTIISSKLLSQLQVRVTAVGSRFLVVSYGITSFTHAWIYDFAYRRWGKVKLTHVAAFEFYQPNLYGDLSWEDLGDLSWEDLGDSTWEDLGTGLDTVEKPKEFLAFLQSDGNIQVVNFDLVHVGDNGVLILGKYKFVRERLLTMDSIEVENIDQEYINFEIRLFTSMDGKNNYRTSIPYLKTDTRQYREYLTNATGKNHSVGLIGTFHVTSMQLNFHLHGRS